MSEPYNPPHYRDSNTWEPLPTTEPSRIVGCLQKHLKKMNITMGVADRITFVETLLRKQGGTCAFGTSANGRYCWNEPKDNFNKDRVMSEVKYLRLQWGHIEPRSRANNSNINNLCLLCARCNNHIQSSRQLHQLEAELMSKLENIQAMIAARATV
jgi:hypothetical protein